MTLSRRDFLRGQPRPPTCLPWANPDFNQRCSRCGECAAVCPQHIIVQNEQALPYIDFQQGGCSFCGECVRVCKTEALQFQADAAWAYRAHILATCLTAQGVECRVCGEICEVRAIRFRLQVGGVAKPFIDKDICTGCGMCVSPCPVRAVEIL